ncbi:tetratricopeptide repeat protein [Lichenicola sp.]|uniref:tetratricopeptide repeat-containing glycosyltransferase family protein n=1 Tax=Lichenicola sp. TaxID=2804529 RepID=UPI003B000F52
MGTADTIFATGNILLAQGRTDEAIALYRNAVQLSPGHAGVRTNLGIALVRLRQFDEALVCFRAAAALQPSSAAAQGNLARVLGDLGRTDEAIACHRRACMLSPEAPAAHFDLAQALHIAERLDEAFTAYHAWLSLAPEDAPERALVHNNIGNILRKQDQPDRAVASYRIASQLQPMSAEILVNLGNALIQQRHLSEAEQCFRTAVRIRPQHVDGHAGLALALLTEGALAEGFSEYEWRWQTPQMIRSARAFEQPQWTGEPAAGRTLLIHAEQGFGDTLQFCRYAPLAAARGMRVVLEVQRPLQRLLQRLPGVGTVIARGDTLPPFDLHCPMLSLPLAFGTTLGSIPSEPCLDADPIAVAAWAERLQAMCEPPTGGQPRDLLIGLVWAGNPYRGSPVLEAVDRRRSVPPGLLRPLFDVPGARFVSLQKERVTTPGDARLLEPMDAVADFADTAALVSNLDLVITVDTAVAHLAASLGRPVWLLDRFDACWRWHDGRRDSPWYPGLRIYRQAGPGEWNGLLIEVEHDLRSLASAARTSELRRR